MDYLRHQLGEGVARARPELLASDQQRLIDQIIELIERYNADLHAKPLTMVAVDEKRDLNSRNGRSTENGSRFESGAIGFVAACRQDGKITEVIQNGLGHGSRVAPDVAFSDVVSPFHSRKAARFLRDIQPDRGAYDCPLSVLGPSGMVRLFCSGFSVGPLIVVIATEEPLATSIPPELSRLAEKKPARLGPVLKELAAWRKHQRNASAVTAHDRPHGSEAAASSEIAASHPTPAGRRRLLDVAAHDLRNPISGILAACQYLMEDASRALEPHQVLILYSIESSSRVALQLLQDLVEIPSIQLGKPQLELHSTDLVAVVHEAVTAARPLADNMKVQLRVRVREQVPPLRADATKLAEALHGVLVNAIGPSPAQGQVEITVGSHSGDATILMRREYSTAGRPSATPPGPSGSRNTRRRLSDIHAAMLLARTRRIVEAHGGALRVEAPGKHDSSWTMTLPAAVGHAARKR